MALNDSIRYMPRERTPRTSGSPITPRQAVGDLVDELIGTRGMTQAGVGERPGMSPMTLRRVLNGVETVRDQKLLNLAAILDLPPRTFLLMIKGDKAAIEELPMDETIRQMVLSTLSKTTIEYNRRAADG